MLAHKERVKILCARYRINAAEAAEMASNDDPYIYGKENFVNREAYINWLDSMERMADYFS